MMKILLLSALIVGLSVVFMAIGLIFKKNGRFPESHVEANPELQKKGITCHRAQDQEERSRKSLKDRLSSEL